MNLLTKLHIQLLALMFIILSLQSCKLLYPNRMFKQGNYEYFSVGRDVVDQYTIEKGDLLSLKVFSREGFDLIDVLPNETGGGMSGMGQGGGGGGQNLQNITYLVEQDGYVELPLFGRTYVLGKTENELENYIEERSKALFNDPYAILQVTNRRAFVFKDSQGSVVSLNQGPTTILEVLAKSGGIGRDLKAYKIKVLRGDLSAPEIIDVDLSSLNGLKNANLIIQSNDVIYIEQRLRILPNLLKEVAPVLSAITTITTVILLIRR